MISQDCHLLCPLKVAPPMMQSLHYCQQLLLPSEEVLIGRPIFNQNREILKVDKPLSTASFSAFSDGETEFEASYTSSRAVTMALFMYFLMEAAKCSCTAPGSANMEIGIKPPIAQQKHLAPPHCNCSTSLGARDFGRSDGRLQCMPHSPASASAFLSSW